MYAGPDHPRIRGEHADDERSVAAGGGSSPHTRGAQRLAGAGDRVFRIIPAYAGSTPVYTLAVVGVRDHPRIRGEHDRGRPAGAGRAGSSPHTRGAPGSTRISGSRMRIIPAYAGSTPEAPSKCPAPGDHPRIRGEHPRSTCGHPRRRGIIPAYAGSTLPGSTRRAARSDHPRIRGEHERRQPAREAGAGSSPHTRGARPGVSLCLLAFGIIPAYAGSTGSSEALNSHFTDHPRIRGEHSPSLNPAHKSRGSSPHTRGALPDLAHLRPEPRIIPAYAGSTPPTGSTWTPTRDHPRIRGEHPRGDRRRPGRRRIIPAYAGSTARPPSGISSSWDHPRIRGEHSWSRKSSGPWGGIIPAYAGSTRR